MPEPPADPPIEEVIAVLFSIDPYDPTDVSYDVFRESEGAEDPISFANALMDSCKPDFPATRLWTFTGNEAAQRIRGERLTRALFGEDE